MSRKTRVCVRGEFSFWQAVISGVPQGSVLGPLLFLIFVNDLPEWIKCSMRLFADDIKIWTRIKKASIVPTQVVSNTVNATTVDGSKLLRNDLNSFRNWSDEWLLRFNCEKCKIMHIGHNLNTEYFMEY